GDLSAAGRAALVAFRCTGAVGERRNAGVLLGDPEVPDAGPAGEPEHSGVPVHAAGRDSKPSGAGTAGNALGVPLAAHLPDLQWLRDVAVQEDGTGSPQPGRAAVEARDAPDPAADLRRHDAQRGVRSHPCRSAPGAAPDDPPG